MTTIPENLTGLDLVAEPSVEELLSIESATPTLTVEAPAELTIDDLLSGLGDPKAFKKSAQKGKKNAEQLPPAPKAVYAQLYAPTPAPSESATALVLVYGVQRCECCGTEIKVHNGVFLEYTGRRGNRRLVRLNRREIGLHPLLPRRSEAQTSTVTDFCHICWDGLEALVHIRHEAKQLPLFDPKLMEETV